MFSGNLGKFVPGGESGDGEAAIKVVRNDFNDDNIKTLSTIMDRSLVTNED